MSALFAILVWGMLLVGLCYASIAAAVREVRTRLHWRKSVRTAKTFWLVEDEEFPPKTPDQVRRIQGRKAEVIFIDDPIILPVTDVSDERLLAWYESVARTATLDSSDQPGGTE